MMLVAVAVLSLLGLSLGKDVSFDFHLDTEIDSALSPDCMNVKEVRRSLFLSNGMFPGPPIEVDEGDNVTVRVHNGNEASSVSIHFHGIHQMGTPYSDGTSFVTQCALGPLQTQEYNFIAYPSGTHYWHEHASYQMVDGITGPLIVRPKDPDPFTYDEERVRYCTLHRLALCTVQSKPKLLICPRICRLSSSKIGTLKPELNSWMGSFPIHLSGSATRTLSSSTARALLLSAN
jgi:Multicopper oxidase